MARLPRLLFGLLLGASLAVACDDDDTGEDHGDHGSETGTHDTGTGQCAELGSVCHESDMGAGMEMECHEVGHAGDEAACAAIYDECIALCTGATGGSTGGSTGGADSSGSGTGTG